MCFDDICCHQRKDQRVTKVHALSFFVCFYPGGVTRAQWEDVTGSTPLTFVNDCVSFTTTVSARFWLMDCRQVNEATKFATELYREAMHVPFVSKFVVFAKRYEPLEALLRVFCMTDDKEEKTLESQEHFTEVAKSRDVEVLEGKSQYIEFAGNLVPVTKSGEQLALNFVAFKENRLAFVMRVRDPHQEAVGRIAFMKEGRKQRSDAAQVPICNLNINLPEVVHEMDTRSLASGDYVPFQPQRGYRESGLTGILSKGDLELPAVGRQVAQDWPLLAVELEVAELEQIRIRSEFADNEQPLAMLRYWNSKLSPTRNAGLQLERALKAIGREDVVKTCLRNVQQTTDSLERAIDRVGRDQAGFDSLKEELGGSRHPSRGPSVGRQVSLEPPFDEKDIMKVRTFGHLDICN